MSHDRTPDRHTQKTVSYRLPERLTEAIRELAKRNRRTLSGEVQLALEAHLASNGIVLSPQTRPKSLPVKEEDWLLDGKE